MANDPSRLLTGDINYQGKYIPIDKYRNMIFSRSLYSLDNEYQNTNKFSLRNKGNVASSISTVLNVIPQYNRMQTSTNLLGNAYDAFRDDGSALAKIGIIMLGKHIAYNSAMNLSVRYLPSIDLSQVLKGNIKGVFKKNEDNTITVKDKETKSFMDKVGGFGSKFLGIETYDVFGNANPFTKNPTNIDYLKNTGTAQLTRFYHAINLNIYKPINPVANSNYSQTVIEYSKKAGVGIDFTRKSILSKQPTFTFGNGKLHPYELNKYDIEAIDLANILMDISYSGNSGTIQEYAPTNDYILNRFGSTTIKEKTGNDNYVPDSLIEHKNDNLVWGRDGVGSHAEAYLKEFHGDEYVNNTSEIRQNYSKFKINNGLLQYTRNLLNATSGQFVDITRKAFEKDGSVIGFQGSPLWRANNSEYAVQNGFLGKTGIRQHTITDPYNRFAKAIRFKGNIVYGGTSDGNQNSVIYKSVLPRIHPTMDKDNNGNSSLNNKNLMFSIENLAVGTIARDKFGVIDDEYGTPIPLSEVGPFAGRMMWFPPYNIQINEVASAKYESTVMIGRNEPMYNYMNSERSATLSFTLLIDYPQQLQDKKYQGKDKNKIIADFFAFGGDALPPEAEIEVIEKKIEDLKVQIPIDSSPVVQAEPPVIPNKNVSVFFPNNEPKTGNTNTIIQEMYTNPNHYEIMIGLESADNGNGFGLNNEIYFRTGLKKITETTWELTGASEQYNVSGVTDQLGDCLLNKYLKEFFQDENTRKYYNIKLTATASKLYLNNGEEAYNKALGLRRINATKNLILSRLTAMFGTTIANDIIKNNLEIIASTGSEGRSKEGEFEKNMHLESVKRDRSSSIRIERNNVPIDDKVQILSSTQKENKEKIVREIEQLERQLIKLKQNNEKLFNDRNEAILHGFNSISENQYYPAFHSQTPEDFHRRLTFLQQCVRQGAAKRYDVIDGDNGALKARNSVFGRQPICILRIADFLYTKVIIENVTIDYADTTWDMNPEGFGMQPMIANVTLSMKIIGGQSLKGPIDALQNAVSFNYYANSNFSDRGVNARASKEAYNQASYINGVLTEKRSKLIAAYDLLDKKVTEGEK